MMLKSIPLFQQQTTFLICLNQNYYEYSVHIKTISYCIKTPRLHPQRTVDLLTILDNYLGKYHNNQQHGISLGKQYEHNI